MKYIRTEDELGVYVEYDGEYKDLNEGTYFKTWRGFSIHEDWKVADTIEELCDGYIIEHPINAFKFFYDKEEMKKCLFNTCMRLFKTHELKVFGCIKIDKGLIYVAKMNDKGELELL